MPLNPISISRICHLCPRPLSGPVPWFVHRCFIIYKDELIIFLSPKSVFSFILYTGVGHYHVLAHPAAILEFCHLSPSTLYWKDCFSCLPRSAIHCSFSPPLQMLPAGYYQNLPRLARSLLTHLADSVSCSLSTTMVYTTGGVTFLKHKSDCDILNSKMLMAPIPYKLRSELR